MSTILLFTPDRPTSRPPIAKPAAWLGGTGLIPFVALAAAGIAGPPDIRATAIEWLVRYGAVIVTFVGAVHWGVLMRDRDASPSELWIHLGWSVVPALGAWVAMALGSPAGLIALMALFAAQLVMDRRLLLRHDLVPWFFRLRVRLTLVAIAALGAALAA
jgi:hypothetical protein